MRAHRGLVAIAMALGACDSATESPSPGKGTLNVVVATSGAFPDADGYLVTFADQAGAAIGANAEWSASELEPRSYTLQLTGVAANCSVAGDNPRTVVVEPGRLLTTTFAVACSASVRIVTETTGIDADASGFLVTIGTGTPARVATSGSTVVQSTAAGTLPMVVADVAANCSPDPANPTTIAVVQAFTDVTLRFSCARATGAIIVTLNTNAWGTECDTLFVSMDQELRPLIARTVTRFEEVLSGPHVVAISGLPVDCWVDGDSTFNVTVSGLQTTRVGFRVYGQF